MLRVFIEQRQHAEAAHEVDYVLQALHSDGANERLVQRERRVDKPQLANKRVVVDDGRIAADLTHNGEREGLRHRAVWEHNIHHAQAGDGRRDA